MVWIITRKTLSLGTHSKDSSSSAYETLQVSQLSLAVDHGRLRSYPKRHPMRRWDAKMLQWGYNFYDACTRPE